MPIILASYEFGHFLVWSAVADWFRPEKND